ncbi:hypothetical protein [Streptomyces sp. NPDC048269]|uniref:hypothetical protein n=1 Tax=Streptomyces sp. NPDC048269 TaxID=3155753 RepID=UPI00343CF096
MVADLAQHETRHFEKRVRAHFRASLPWSGWRPTRSDPLGLPGELVTPVVLAVATALLGAVSTELVTRISERTARRLGRRRPVPAQDAPDVAPAGETPSAAASAGPTASELAQWHASTLAAALGCHVEEEKARRIADATLAVFVQHMVGAPGPSAQVSDSEATAAENGPPSSPREGDGHPVADS